MKAVSSPSQPQSQPAGKRKANTSTASLHAETVIATAVSKAVSAALATLDVKFEVRFNTLKQAIADTNTSLKALKSYTEAINNSLNALKNYTKSPPPKSMHDSSTASIRPRSANLPRCRRAPSLQWLNHGVSHTDHMAVELQGVLSPREKAADFSRLFTETIALIGDALLLFLDEFNARHPDWGFTHTDPKGRTLWLLVQDLCLTLINNLRQPPTRIGNSVCHDTSPDPTLCKNVTRATWDNMGLLVGSDHNILVIKTQTRLRKKPKHTARITDWPKFCQLREEQASYTIRDINEWIASWQEHVQVTTREVETTTDLPTTDSRLLHM
ncbi:hypothetical protein HPB51_023603 [Rhipicephalus microplus]|uniref:Endonuclease/exonuclease/phosphatase domain-containing protein n=1 Tax=Rhipicephalus microplus TaxID=6941 RepID=A0A9J6DKI1_RHIMP|nr:hypothetical protein HPB51_023603 [Rhipicephalus microplus]